MITGVQSSPSLLLLLQSPPSATPPEPLPPTVIAMPASPCPEICQIIGILLSIRPNAQSELKLIMNGKTA